jgi:hypothetical protein
MDAIEFGSVIDDNDDHFLKTSYSNGCDWIWNCRGW